MRHYKRMLSICLIMLMLFSLCVPAFAYTSEDVDGEIYVIKLSCTWPSPYSVDDDMLFDLRGVSITAESSTAFIVESSYALYIQGSGSVISSNGAGVEVLTEGSLYLEGQDLTVTGTTYGLDIASGATVELSGGTFIGTHAAIRTADNNFEALLKDGYAFYDADGKQLSPDEVASHTTVSVKERTEIVDTGEDAGNDPANGEDNGPAGNGGNTGSHLTGQEQVPTRDTYTTTVNAVVPEVIGRGTEIELHLTISRVEADGSTGIQSFRFIEHLKFQYDTNYFTMSILNGDLYTVTDVDGNVEISSNLEASHTLHTSADLPVIVLTVKDTVKYVTNPGYVQFDDSELIVTGSSFSSPDGKFNQIMAGDLDFTVAANDTITMGYDVGDYVEGIEDEDLMLRGETRPLPEVVVIDPVHYEFDGWSESPAGEDLKQPGDIVTYTKDTIMYVITHPKAIEPEEHPVCAAEAHVWGDWVIVTEAALNVPGLEYRKCTVCGFKQTVEVPAIEACQHEWGSWQITEEADYEHVGHQYRVCSVCGEKQESEIAMLEACTHSWGEWVVTVEPGYLVDGSQYRVCSVCSEKYEMTLPGLTVCAHVYGEWDITEEADYDHAGSMTRYCTVPKCDASETVEIPQLTKCEHVFGAWEITKQAGVGYEGTMKRVCSECGYIETSVISALEEPKPDCANGHVWGIWLTVKAATENEEGLEQRVCGRCGYVQTATVAKHIDHDHTFCDWIIIKESEYQVEGQIYRFCTVCGYTQTVFLPAREDCAHVWGDWTDIVNPTYESDGSMKQVCSICSAEYVVVLPKLILCDHEFDDWVIINECGYGLTGRHERVCHLCGFTQIDIIPALTLCTHEFTEWTVTREAGVGEEGSQERSCTICGYTQTAVIDALPAEGEVITATILELGAGPDAGHPGVVAYIPDTVPTYKTAFYGKLEPFDPNVFDYTITLINPESDLPQITIKPNEDGGFLIPEEYMTEDLTVTIVANIIGAFRVTAFGNDIALVKWERDYVSGGTYSFQGHNMVYTDIYGTGAYALIVTTGVDEFDNWIANAKTTDLEWAGADETAWVYGSRDINADSASDYYDANYIIAAFNGWVKLSAEDMDVFASLLRCDLNGDGKVDVSDFVLWYTNN